ncbi:NAD(P)-dependent oxidoreductase [Aureimonas populi]|uniref:NAD(P)-dependent oxidoreductase n=1 Tax=Aureimonas populi TaxID=1701758 RepID=A0ABW5CJZ6_9HYPH|nr:NAD(P)-dependent oxidoreductase [Aureimonas populi]
MSVPNETSVAMVGLGSMGLGMAGTLATKGFSVTGFDLSPARLEAAAALGVRPAADLAEALPAARFIVFSLPTARDVAGVVEAHLPLIGSRAGGRVIVVDTSTSEPGVSRDLAARLDAAGHGFLDAPVSGGPAGAAAGKLAMMIGGAEGDLALARPVIEALAAHILHVGPSGAGNVAKLVNNLLVAAHMITTAEGLKLAAAAGVEPEAVLRVLNAASGKTFLSEVHFPTWIMSGRFDSGFSMGLMKKDVRLAEALARESGVELPLTAEAARLWEESAGALADTDDFTRMGAFKPAGR